MGVKSFGRKLRESWKKKTKSLNEAVTNSIVGKYFKLEARRSSFTTEVRAGTATFLTMVYIIVVNATILSDSGGTCSMADCTPTETIDLTLPPTPALQPGQQAHPPALPTLPTLLKPIYTEPGPDCVLKHNRGYERCLAKTKSDLIVATVVSSMIGCFAMGIFANLPLALAPGMGVNAYFAYTLVGFHGSGSMTYQTALAVCLVQGVAFLTIAILGLRGKLARLIPPSVRLASAAGIGLFIAFTGLQKHEGVGLIGPSSSTLVTLAACSKTNPDTGECITGILTSSTFWIGVAGFLIMSYSSVNKIKGSIIYGIIVVTVVSWDRDTSFTAFPYTLVGQENYEYFTKIVDFHKIKSTAGALSFSDFSKTHVWLAMLTLLYVEVFGTTSVLYSMAEIGGFMNERGGFEGEYTAFMVDAGSTVVGSLLGTSPIATFVESSAGIKEGGRTGLTAVIVGFYFFLSLFFTPILVSVPPWAIGPALVMVGLMMMKAVKDIKWADPKEGIPAFVTMLLMPLTYNISYGLIGGIGLYVALQLPHYVDRLVAWMVHLWIAGRMKNQVSAALGHDQSGEVV